MCGIKPGNAQFFAQAPDGAFIRALTPMGMRAAGIGPKPGRVILARRAALDQNVFTVQHKDGHRLVAESFAVHVQLVDGDKRVTHPGGNKITHRHAKLVAPSQDWPAAALVVTWSACP